MRATHRPIERFCMSPSVKLFCIDPELVHKIWDRATDFIKPAMQRGGMGDFSEVERDVLSGDALLWVAYDPVAMEILAGAVTQLTIENEIKTCTIVACGGKGWSRFGHFVERLEQFAKDEGCSGVRICGRKGWARVLPGYRIKRVILEKAL